MKFQNLLYVKYIIIHLYLKFIRKFINFNLNRYIFIIFNRITLKRDYMQHSNTETKKVEYTFEQY